MPQLIIQVPMKIMIMSRLTVGEEMKIDDPVVLILSMLSSYRSISTVPDPNEVAFHQHRLTLRTRSDCKGTK